MKKIEATTANLMGPFLREGSPAMNNGDSMEPGVDATPPPPITGKAEGARAELVVLRRRE